TNRAAAASQPRLTATRTKTSSSAAGSRSRQTKTHLSRDIRAFQGAAPHQPCWRHGSDRLWSSRCDDKRRGFGASLWIGVVACLHINAEPTSATADLVCGPPADPVVPKVTAAKSSRDVFDIYT